VIVIGLPVAWVVCDFKWTRDGFIGIAVGLLLFALLEPLKKRKAPPSGPVAGFRGSDLDVDDARGTDGDLRGGNSRGDAFAISSGDGASYVASGMWDRSRMRLHGE
jgi:hypothetical protein